MSFLGGLGSFVGTAGPIAANIGGDYEQAQAQGSQMRNQQAIQMLMMQRQQRAAEIENTLNISKTAEQNALADQHRQEMDPNFAGQKAGAIAAAQWPEKEAELRAQLDNNLQLEKARGATEAQIAAQRIAGEQGIESMRIQNAMQLQQNSQTFQQGQQTRQQQFQQNVVLPTEAQNKIQGIQQTQRGEIIPSIMNKIHGTSEPTPSSTPTAPLTLQQSQRAATDPDYKQFLISQGYSL